MRSLLIMLVSILCLFFASHSDAATATDVAYNSYATTNATTSAYTTLFASTARPFAELFVCDTSGHFIKLALGAAGSEVDLSGLPVSGCFSIHVGRLIPVGSRVSFKAVDANATTGGLMVTGVQ